MTNEMFKKEAFKKSVKDNVKFLYRKTIEEATQEQIFQAVSYSVKDVIIDNWLATQKAYDEQDPKIVYYMSMEFLKIILHVLSASQVIVGSVKVPVIL